MFFPLPQKIKSSSWLVGLPVAILLRHRFFTVSSPLSASYVERSSRDASYTLNMSADNKHRKHGDACRRNNVVFWPLPVQTFGSWHPDAFSELKRLGIALAKRSPGDERIVINHFFQRLAVVLQRGNAHLLLSRQPSYPQRHFDCDWLSPYFIM